MKNFFGIKIVAAVAALCAVVYFFLGTPLGGKDEGSSLSLLPGATAALDKLKPEERLNLKKNIIVMGIDEREDDIGRSDTLFVVMFDSEAKTAGLLSVPRDTRVHIKDHGWDKINHTYGFGGRELTQQTVEELLGIRINNYVMVDFAGFTGVIDAIGGVDIDVEKDMYYYDDWDGFEIDLKAGRQHLDGKAAIQYVRYRDEDGDIGRIARQQHFLMAVYDKIKSADMLLKIPGLAKQLSLMVKTDLPLADMASMGRAMHSLISERGLAMATVPGDPIDLEEINYWIPNITLLREQMAQMQGADYTDTYKSAAELLEKEYATNLAAAVRESEENEAKDKNKSRRVRKDARKRKAKTDRVQAELSAEEKAVIRARERAKLRSSVQADLEALEKAVNSVETPSTSPKITSKPEGSRPVAPGANVRPQIGATPSKSGATSAEDKAVVRKSPQVAKKASEASKASGSSPRVRTGRLVRLVNCSGRGEDTWKAAASSLMKAGFSVLNGGSGERIANTVAIATTNDGAVISQLARIPFKHSIRVTRDSTSNCDAVIMLGEDFR